MAYQIGDVVTGVVSGIQKYGAFVRFADGQQGLVHISEFKSGVVKNLYDELTVGQSLQVIVLDIDLYTGKISLSVRQLAMMPLKDEPLLKNNHQKKRFWTNYHLDYGFAPIARNWDGWVAEALNRI
ncbi:CvfD/Ygs/GSP13 family RNA-binding post-transcriptional regulator [Leuconostocaceae bacterium ESL0723]|nr:CvfD/Ygs/GSP13 family RNA-binding post-transcriptional regulator [Leuconostocaceae bacterium ESL0723]